MVMIDLPDGYLGTLNACTYHGNLDSLPPVRMKARRGESRQLSLSLQFLTALTPRCIARVRYEMAISLFATE